MTIETKITQRALNPTESAKKNIITARRGVVPQAGGSITIPKRVSKIILKNTHASNSFAINFNDDNTGHYWTLKPSEILTLDISDRTIVKIKGIGGDSSFEAIIF